MNGIVWAANRPTDVAQTPTAGQPNGRDTVDAGYQKFVRESTSFYGGWHSVTPMTGDAGPATEHHYVFGEILDIDVMSAFVVPLDRIFETDRSSTSLEWRPTGFVRVVRFGKAAAEFWSSFHMVRTLRPIDYREGTRPIIARPATPEELGEAIRYYMAEGDLIPQESLHDFSIDETTLGDARAAIARMPELPESSDD